MQTVAINMIWLITSHLIWIYTVCFSAFDFGLNPLFATMDMFKFKDGRVQFLNLRLKGLRFEWFCKLTVKALIRLHGCSRLDSCAVRTWPLLSAYVSSWPRWLSWMRVRLETRRLRVQSPPRSANSFVEIDHEIFSTVILSSADSRRAVVSFWRKNMHNTG